MTRLLVLFAFAAPAGAALAQTETLCAQLFGTRQTALRMAETGFSFETTARETLARREWREATPEERGWAVRVIREACETPGPSSRVILACRERAAGRSPERQEGTTR